MDVALHAAVVAATGVVALLVLAANPRRNWNQWLASFLLLVSANFALVGLGPWLQLQIELGTVDPAWAVRTGALAQRLGYVVQAADPAALVYFASVFPRRTGLAASRWGAVVVWAPATAFLVAEVAGRALSEGMRDDVGIVAAWALYLSAFYAYACARLLLSLLEERSGIMARQVGALALGVLVAMLPRIALSVWRMLPHDVWRDDPVLAGALDLGLRLALLWAAFAAAWLLVRRAPAAAERRAAAAGTLRLVGLACVAFSALWIGAAALRAAAATGLLPGLDAAAPGGFLQTGLLFTIRWFVFVAAVAAGILRYEVLSVRPSTLADAGTVAAGAAVFLVAALGADVLGPWVAGALATGALAGAVAGVRRARVAVGHAPRPARATEVYAALLAAELASPGGGDAARLAEARRSLGISADDHRRLAAAAEAEEAAGSSPAVLGRYTTVRRLGAGGSATALLVLDREHGELRVLKEYHRDWLGEAGVRDAARREVEVARRVSHPNLVAVHDLVATDAGLFLVTEYAEGGSLRDLLRDRGPLPPAEVAAIGAQALAGLEALHEAGVVHGDLKPENVLLDGGGRVKLADFGAARASPGRRTLAHGDFHGAAAGTMLYMAPEQLQGAPATPATDLYALGAVLYELRTGRPYGAERPWDRGAPRPRFAPAWEGLFRRALAPEPSDRFPTAPAMLDALRACERRPALPPLRR